MIQDRRKAGQGDWTGELCSGFSCSWLPHWYSSFCLHLWMSKLFIPYYSLKTINEMLFYSMCTGVLPTCVSLYHDGCGACRVQKRALESLELELWASMWVMGTKPGSSGRTAEPVLTAVVHCDFRHQIYSIWWQPPSQSAASGSHIF